jgi:hypothetical protein
MKRERQRVSDRSTSASDLSVVCVRGKHVHGSKVESRRVVDSLWKGQSGRGPAVGRRRREEEEEEVVVFIQGLKP